MSLVDDHGIWSRLEHEAVNAKLDIGMEQRSIEMRNEQGATVDQFKGISPPVTTLQKRWRRLSSRPDNPSKSPVRFSHT
jgi:hypothetical protein